MWYVNGTFKSCSQYLPDRVHEKDKTSEVDGFEHTLHRASAQVLILWVACSCCSLNHTYTKQGRQSKRRYLSLGASYKCTKSDFHLEIPKFVFETDWSPEILTFLRHFLCFRDPTLGILIEKMTRRTTSKFPSVPDSPYLDKTEKRVGMKSGFCWRARYLVNMLRWHIFWFIRS